MGRTIVEGKVAAEIALLPRGSVMFVDDFLDFGSPESIKKALLRLKEKGILARLAHGIYLYPKVDTELGVLMPSADEIAFAIARRDKARIVPAGAHALNKLGLSPQVPMKVVYLTDGAARIVKIGKQAITFKKVSPKILQTKGEISTLAIQALKTIGQFNLNTETLDQLCNIVKREPTENVLHDAKLAPAWINKILTQTVYEYRLAHTTQRAKT